MADAEKREKLAAARKKLKQFQVKSTKTTTSLKPNPASDSLTKKPELQIETFKATNNCQVPAETTPDNNLANELPNVDISSSRSSISSSESIRQISLQLNGLMSETHNFINGAVEEEPPNTSELEKRNLELAASVEKHIQTNELIQSQNQELKNQNNKLRQDLQNQKEEIEERHIKELGSLKEQLQVHIQTIGILVAEKTELQSSLNQSQQSAKQKAAEVEELQGRLQATRQRIIDTEKDFTSVQTNSQQFEKSSKEFSKEVDRLKIELYKANKKMEEIQEENSELSEKLNSKIVHSQSLQEQLDNTKSNLAMADLRLQQLSGSDDNKQFWEELSEEKIQLEKKVNQLKDTVQKLSQERDNLSEQHQQFAQQLNQQMQHLSEQLTSVIEEKAVLANEKLFLANRVNSLEGEISQLNKESIKMPFANEEAERLQSMLQMAEDEKLRLQEQHEKDVADNAHLSHLSEELERRIEELESHLENTKEDEADRKQLLEEIESDKVAVSRAVAQNRELKKQLEELQNGFIIISNNKLELVEKLESEQHISKELSERLTQQEEEMKELREQLENRDRDYNTTEMNKHMYQQQQLVDRVRHYEAQSQLTELLQRELSQSQDRLNVLTTQNTELRSLLTQQGQQMIFENGRSDEKDSGRKDDMLASLSASVRQLEMERDALLKQLGQQQGQREVFRAQLKEMKENNLHQVNSENGESLSSTEYENMKDVMKKLEERFTKTMQEIAELSDQKQELEHLVTQLQGETDTIGEYIALYQVQRGIMKQRAIEKDEYIAHLAQDREYMKSKLTKLQELVMRLLYERQQYSTNQIETIQHPPGKAVPSSDSNIALKMTALNDADSLPNWSDLDEDLNEINPLMEKGQSERKINMDNNTDTTAKKIMDLITEIGSSSLVEKHSADNFHPCPVCSGKLMIV